MQIETKLRSMRTYSSSSSFIVHLLIWMQTIHLQWLSGCFAKANGVGVGDAILMISASVHFGPFILSLFFFTLFVSLSLLVFVFSIHSGQLIRITRRSYVDRTTPAAISRGSFFFLSSSYDLKFYVEYGTR